MEQKIEQQELEKIQEISKKYEEITVKFGQLQVQRILLQQQLDKLNDEEDLLKSEYGSNQLSERNLMVELNTKYGEGSLNLQTGVFVSATT